MKNKIKTKKGWKLRIKKLNFKKNNLKMDLFMTLIINSKQIKKFILIL